jgi:peptidoglycan hydrolase-like protein with peptidoglycan-binding domain
MIIFLLFAMLFLGLTYFPIKQTAAQVPSTQVQPTTPPSLPTPICNPNSPTLQYGSTGAKVAELQRVLTQLGYGSLLGRVGIDGKFGPSTQNAVKKFQVDNRLQVDGKAGPITLNALCRMNLSQQQVSSQSSTSGGIAQPMSSAIKKFRAGFAAYGIGSLTSKLVEMKNTGKIQIGDDQLDIIRKVARVESGGQVNAINSWDSAIMSFGFMQWTLRYGELQKLISQVPDVFKEYGIELAGTYNFGHGTKADRVPGIKGVTDPNELRNSIWADKFFKAGQDPRIIQAEVKMAIDELNTLYNKLRTAFQKNWSTNLDSPIARALVFELHNNRPAYVYPVIYRTLQQINGQNISEQALNNLLIQQIVQQYTIKENDPSKAQRWTSVILKA